MGGREFFPKGNENTSFASNRELFIQIFVIFDASFFLLTLIHKSFMKGGENLLHKEQNRANNKRLKKSEHIKR